MAEGARIGVTGTPALYVNGIMVDGGAVPYEIVAYAIRRSSTARAGSKRLGQSSYSLLSNEGRSPLVRVAPFRIAIESIQHRLNLLSAGQQGRQRGLKQLISGIELCCEADFGESFLRMSSLVEHDTIVIVVYSISGFLPYGFF